MPEEHPQVSPDKAVKRGRKKKEDAAPSKKDVQRLDAEQVEGAQVKAAEEDKNNKKHKNADGASAEDAADAADAASKRTKRSQKDSTVAYRLTVEDTAEQTVSPPTGADKTKNRRLKLVDAAQTDAATVEDLPEAPAKRGKRNRNRKAD